MAQLAPFFRTVFTEVDGDGNVIPLAGGKLYTYVSGTTTPKATYTDQGGLTANANPIILDSGGGCDLWLDTTGAYTLLLTDSDDATIDTWNAVSAVPASVTGSYLPLAGGTVTGAITLAGNATASLHAVPLQQANSLIAAAIATEVTNRNSAIAAVALPDQDSHAGEVLKTNGTAASWSPVKDLVAPTTGTNGSTPLWGGLILKWGTTGSLTADTSDNTITFPTPFPTSCYAVVATASTSIAAGSSAVGQSTVHTFSASSFRINNEGATTTFTYFAIGI